LGNESDDEIVVVQPNRVVLEGRLKEPESGGVVWFVAQPGNGSDAVERYVDRVLPVEACTDQGFGVGRLSDDDCESLAIGEFNEEGLVVVAWAESVRKHAVVLDPEAEDVFGHESYGHALLIGASDSRS